MLDQASWTLDELVQRVAVCLADPAYPGAPDGRVRDLPDGRAVRWSPKTRLVDRPAIQGRTALYHHRHLLQVVAVKRRQAEGCSLAEVQAELTGATDDTLRRVAAIARKSSPSHRSLNTPRPGAAEPPQPVLGQEHRRRGTGGPAQRRRR